MRLARAGLADADADADADDDELAAAGLVVVVLAVVIPEVHAASDRLAAHAVRAATA